MSVRSLLVASALIISAIVAMRVPTKYELQVLASVHAARCGNRYRLSNSTMMQVILTKDIETLAVTNDIQCFMKCLIYKSDFAVDGQLHRDKFIAVLVAYGQPEPQIRRLFENCKNYYRDGEECSPMWNLYLCFHGLITYEEPTTKTTAKLCD